MALRSLIKETIFFLLFTFFIHFKLLSAIRITGKITSENERIEYTLKINDTANIGVLNEKLIMDRENYYKLIIKNKEIKLKKVKPN